MTTRGSVAPYSEVESPRHPTTPEPHYEDGDSISDVSNITITIGYSNHSVVLNIPEPDNDKDSSIADSKPVEVGSLVLDSSRTSSAFKHLPGYKGIQDQYGLNSINGAGRTPESPNSSRVYRADDPKQMVNFGRCGYSLLFEWIVTFVFITLLLTASVYFYPDSPLVWLNVIALIILIIKGLAVYFLGKTRSDQNNREIFV